MADIREQIHEYVGTLLAEHGYTEAVADDTPLVSSGLLDSFAVIRLVVFMEKTFGVSFAGEYFDHNRFDSIAAMVELVKELMSPGSS